MQCILYKIYFSKVFRMNYNLICTPICTKKFILVKSGCYRQEDPNSIRWLGALHMGPCEVEGKVGTCGGQVRSASSTWVRAAMKVNGCWAGPIWGGGGLVWHVGRHCSGGPAQ
jgi:hypothetical protein